MTTWVILNTLFFLHNLGQGESASSTNCSIKSVFTAQEKYCCCVANMNEAKLGWEGGLSLVFQTQWYSVSFLNYTLLISHSPLNNCLTCSYSKHAVKGFKIEDTTFRKKMFFPEKDDCLSPNLLQEFISRIICS